MHNCDASYNFECSRYLCTSLLRAVNSFEALVVAPKISLLFEHFCIQNSQ